MHQLAIFKLGISTNPHRGLTIVLCLLSYIMWHLIGFLWKKGAEVTEYPWDDIFEDAGGQFRNF